MCIYGDICAYVYQQETVADPGFPIEGGHQLLTQAPFSENVHENERIGSYLGGTCTGSAPPPWIRK